MDLDSILDDDLDIQILNDNGDEPMPEEPQVIVNTSTVKSNPVEQHLLKQLQCVNNRIEQAKHDIEVIDDVTEKILQNLSIKSAYREDDCSDSDSDMFTSTGDPVIKKKMNKLFERQKVLEVQHVWQRVIDDKWIIGVVIESTTSCVITEPTVYVVPKNKDDEYHGVSVFWTLVDDTNWYPTEKIESNEQLVATVTLDLPNFNSAPEIEAYGTIFCQFNDKLFQTPIPPIKLSAQETINGTCAVDFDDDSDAQLSIIALKAISVDRVVLLPMQPDSSTGKRLLQFLNKYDFKEVCKVCVVRNVGSLQYCVLEVLPAAEDTDPRVLLSARSEAQLSVVIQLMREDFPELLDVEKQQMVYKAARSLREELQLYLECDNPAKLQRARVKSDLLIP